MADINTDVRRGMQSARLGIVANAILALIKLLAGIIGNTYALIADAVESTADIFSSLVVWGGLQVAGRDPDDEYPFGYGKAEALAASVVSLMLLGAATGIAIAAVREIGTPHRSPAPWTLGVLIMVMIAKWWLSRRSGAIGSEIGSTAVKADAWHHLSDAITSALAFIGISIAIWGGPGWQSADAWAALLASGIIAYNGVAMLRPSIHDLMDRMPHDLVEPVRRAAESVSGVLATEKLAVRKSGITYRVTLHVQTDPTLSIRNAHIIGGMVKSAILAQVPRVQSVLVHLEPFEQPHPR
jgi:cation diffusion facilitator family transporter